MNDLSKVNKILVAGLGKSGLAVLDSLLALGVPASVYDVKGRESLDPGLLDMLRKKNVNCYHGETSGLPEKFDIVVISPGISPESEFIKKAEDDGSVIIGELEFAFMTGKGNFVAITGTNGKTTTTALTGEIFKNAGLDAYVAGNIGVAVSSVVWVTRDESWLITEVSSFQLETIRNFKPRISAILNITPDHLDRHKTMERYIEAKSRVFINQDENDYFVVNYDDKETYALSSGCKAKVVPFSRISELEFGVFVKDGIITARGEDGKLTEFCGVKELLIPGEHNIENAVAAAAISYFIGIQPAVIAETLKTFKGVEHRLEFAGEKNGVRFVNDSKATNPDASIKAVRAIEGSIVLIAGGYDKNSSFDGFIEAFGGKVKHMALLGATAAIIKETAERKGFNNSAIHKDMEECVNKAFELAEPGDTVLLSPACASWDMYNSFEERGAHFKNCVNRLGN